MRKPKRGHQKVERSNNNPAANGYGGEGGSSSTSASEELSAGSSQSPETDEEKYIDECSRRRREQYVRVRSGGSGALPRHKQPLQKLVSIQSENRAGPVAMVGNGAGGGGVGMGVATSGGGHSIRSTNYYTTTNSRYRKLDEIFDRQMSLGGGRSRSNYWKRFFI